jgi:hypothetical protein
MEPNRIAELSAAAISNQRRGGDLAFRVLGTRDPRHPVPGRRPKPERMGLGPERQNYTLGNWLAASIAARS